MRSGRLLLTPGLFPLLGIIVPLLALVPSPAHALNTGDPGPDFSLMDLDGNVQSVSESLGKVVVLYFLGYEADVCADPVRQIQTRIVDRSSERQLQVFGVDCWDGTAEQLRRFRDANAVRFPLLLGGSRAADAYDLPYNSVVVLDARGLVTYLSVGPEPDSFDEYALEQAIKRTMDNAASISEETWGAIKTLYSNRKRMTTSNG